MSKDKVTMLDLALRYVRKFHAVVPIGTWTFQNKEGKEIDLWKSPLIKNWTNEPLRTEADVKREWHKYMRWGNAPSIGLVTGQINGGYIVIDLDNKPEKGINGYDTLKNWEWEFGEHLPEDTWTVLTGGGGYHLYFHTDKPMRSYTNLELGVDLRADGGQVLVPPSLHPSGRRYEWEYSPKEYDCAEATQAVYDFIEYCRPSGSQYRPSERRGESCGERKMVLPPEIMEGGRHEPLIKLIGSMNRYGCDDETIIQAVISENEKKCKPPLSEEEMEREIIPAVYRYEKGVCAAEWKSEVEWRQDQAMTRLASQALKN